MKIAKSWMFVGAKPRRNIAYSRWLNIAIRVAADECFIIHTHSRMLMADGLI